MADNWIERKVLREKNLRERAADVWQDVSAAVQSACNSFNKHEASNGREFEIERRNGHYLTALIIFGKNSGDATIRRVAIQFDERKTNISVAVDDGSAKIFPLRADETHCYIEFEGREITSEQFSEIALYDALYKEPAPKIWKKQG